MRRRDRRVLNVRNRVVCALAALALVYAAIGAAFGAAGIAFLAAQSAVTIFVLQTINYVQHYGLVRRAMARQRYEPITAIHSWNSGHVVSNWLLLNLGHHSDHHCDAAKSHLVLGDEPGAPQLPTGLFGMLLLALFPPLWRTIMDPLAQDIRVRTRTLTGTA